jgi:enoyl-CoA hydratase/carnithine racemase
MTAKLLVERQDGVLVLRLSNPTARNALHPDIYAGGLRAFEDVKADASVRAVVIAGEGDIFCAGGNLNRLLENRAKDPALQMASIETLHDWIRAIRDCERPVVAAVEGAAAGAGFSLALACDMIVAAEDAKFTMAYVKVGLSPDGGATHWLGTRLPYPLAFELAALGDPIGAPRLHSLGVVNKMVARGQALGEALAIAHRLARGPAGVVARIKRLVDSAGTHSLAKHLEQERDAFVESLFHPDAGEGIGAFLEKRKPRFAGSE